MSGDDLRNQVTINKTDIRWMKDHIRELKRHMKTQTGLMLSILLTIIGSIIGYLFA